MYQVFINALNQVNQKKIHKGLYDRAYRMTRIVAPNIFQRITREYNFQTEAYFAQHELCLLFTLYNQIPWKTFLRSH